MADLIADTHGAVLAGAGGTAAGETDLGDITLPAGGPWKIFGIWAQAVHATATAAETLSGSIRINSKSGDITPDPSPTKFPIPKIGSFLGASADVTKCPLVIYPIDFEAAGKAVLDLMFDNEVAMTVAPQVVAGILYGKTIPEPRRYRFADKAEGNVTSADDTALATITLSERATKITGFIAEIAQDGVLTAGEELLGYIRLSSDDVNLSPMMLPLTAAYSAGLGGTISAASPPARQPIPVEIPVPGGARIDCFLDLNTAVTNAAHCTVTLFYE